MPTAFVRLLCLGLVLFQAPVSSALEVGEQLPEAALDIELTDLDGNHQTLGGLWGAGGAMLVFAANSCPYVLDWADRLPTLAAFAGANQISFVLLNANERQRRDRDSPAAMAEFLAQLETAPATLEMPYLVDQDSRLASALGAQRTPEVFLFDRDKQLVYHGAIDDHSGPLSEVSEHWAADALDQLVAGEEVLNSSTAPIGCAVLKPRRRRPVSSEN